MEASVVRDTVRRNISAIEDADGQVPASARTWLNESYAHLAAIFQSRRQRQQHREQQLEQSQQQDGGIFETAMLLTISVLLALLDACSAVVSQIMKQVHESEEVNAQLMVQVTHLEQESDKTSQEKSNLRLALEAAKKKISELQELDLGWETKLKCKLAEIDELNKKLKEMDVERESVLQMAKQSQKDLAESNATVRSLTEKIHNLERRLEELVAKKTEVEKESALNKRNAEVQSDREEETRGMLFTSRQELQRFQTQYLAMVKKCNELQRDLERRDAERSSQIAEVMTSMKSLSQSKSTLYRTQATQTSDPSKKSSLVLTKNLMRVESMAEEVNRTVEVLRRSNHCLDEFLAHQADGGRLQPGKEKHFVHPGSVVKRLSSPSMTSAVVSVPLSRLSEEWPRAQIPRFQDCSPFANTDIPRRRRPMQPSLPDHDSGVHELESDQIPVAVVPPHVEMEDQMMTAATESVLPDVHHWLDARPAAAAANQSRSSAGPEEILYASDDSQLEDVDTASTGRVKALYSGRRSAGRRNNPVSKRVVPCGNSSVGKQILKPPLAMQLSAADDIYDSDISDDIVLGAVRYPPSP